MTKPTKVPAIPKPPATVDPQTKVYLENLAEAVEIRLGRKGDPRDRAITLRELIESGLAKDLKASPWDPNNFGSSNIGFAPEPNPILTVPPQPTGFTASGAYSMVILNWDFPNYANHSHTEIWSYDQDVLGDATLAGIDSGRVFTDPVGSGISRYYWIRHISTSDIEGPWNASSGTLAATATDVAHQLAVLAGAITSSQLATDLATPIGNLPSDTATELTSLQSQINTLSNVGAWASGTAYAVTDLVTYSGNLYECAAAHTASNSNKPTGSSSNNSYWTFVGAYSSLAAAVAGNTSSITDVNYINSSSSSAAAVKIASLDATVNDASTGVSATATALSSLSSTVSTQGTSISTVASDVTTLSTTVGTNSTSISTQATSINGLEGQYSVKIDTNDHVSGFGLSSTAVDGTPTSAFIVRADKFAIIDPADTTTGLTNSPPADTVPFFIDSGNTYIKTAMIEDASITSAKIGTVNADTINAGTLDAARIDTDSISASKLQIDNNVLGQAANGDLVLATSSTSNGRGVKTENLSYDATGAQLMAVQPNYVPVSNSPVSWTQFTSSFPNHTATIYGQYGQTQSTYTLTNVVQTTLSSSKIKESGNYFINFGGTPNGSLTTTSSTSESMMVLGIERQVGSSAWSEIFSFTTVVSSNGVTPLGTKIGVVSPNLSTGYNYRFTLRGHLRGFSANNSGQIGYSKNYIQIFKIHRQT